MTDTFLVELSAPWDAAWLAERWPDVFSLVDTERGTVNVKDILGLVKVSKQTHNVDVGFDGEGLTLRVFNTEAELVCA